MDWVTVTEFSMLQKLAMQIITSGRVPHHIAVIMDGNRRYANKNGQCTIDGHIKGFEKLSEVIYWCTQLGVKEVTIYAMSIDNMKRSKQQVAGLLGLAELKMEIIINDAQEYMDKGMKFQVIGNGALLSPEMQKTFAQAHIATSQCEHRFLTNIAFVYTSRDEITSAIRSVVQGVTAGVLDPADITPYVLEKALYTENSPPPDLLIRTSGEVRLSDFMLWQCSSCCIYFTPALWPEFTLWDLLKGIFHYQRSYNTLQGVKAVDRSVMDSSPRVDAFLQGLYKTRLENLQTMMTHQPPADEMA